MSYEELTRMYTPHESNVRVEYPLIDRKMTRADCVRYVEHAGYRSPPKSGCTFCPFQGLDQWREMYHDTPELYWDAVGLEEMDLNYPRYRLYNAKWAKSKKLTLRRLSDYLHDSVQMDLEGNVKDEMACEQAGYCHV